MPHEMKGHCFSLPMRNTQEKADRQMFAGKAAKTIAATTSALYLAFPVAFVKVSQESSDPDHFPVGCLCQSSHCSALSRDLSQPCLLSWQRDSLESFLLWIWTNLPGHSNTSWSFFRSLIQFYWTAAVNFVSNNGRVEFSNLVFLKISLTFCPYKFKLINVCNAGN